MSIENDQFVGIRNSPEKSQLLQSKNFQIAEARTAGLTFDCERHIDFLDAIEQCKAFSETLYWRYHALLGRQEEWIKTHCDRFANLYRSIHSQGFDFGKGYIAVTDDGIRLNGSHRASIAFHMELEFLPVAVYSWKTKFASDEIAHIADEVKEKLELREFVTGKIAYCRSTGNLLGRVITGDMIWVRKSVGIFLRRNVKHQLYIIENESGKSDYYLAKSVKIKDRK